jgi:hypothetical protein
MGASSRARGQQEGGKKEFTPFKLVASRCFWEETAQCKRQFTSSSYPAATDVAPTLQHVLPANVDICLYRELSISVDS